MTVNRNIPTENVKINVLGALVTLSGKSEITGLVRAANANVFVNQRRHPEFVKAEAGKTERISFLPEQEGILTRL